MIIKNRKKFKRKRFIFVGLFIVFAILSVSFTKIYVSASNNNEIEIELTQSVTDIVDNLNFNKIQDIVESLNDFEIFDGGVKDKVVKILKGDYFTDYANLGNAIISILFYDVKSFLPLVFTIIAVGILFSVLNNFKSGNKGLQDIIYFLCFSVIVILVLVACKDILFGLDKTLNSITSQMQIIFPILITMLTSIGALSSVSIFNPMLSILISFVSLLFKNFLYPLFILIFILTIVGNLTETIKLDKFVKFLVSTFKWSVGIIFTIFTGFVSIQGISAGKFDSVSIKTTKFAMKSYIPLIGSYIAEGMDFLVLGSVLVKNAIGVVGVIILFLTIISPIIQIIIFKLGLQLAGAILELSGAKRISDFLSSFSKILLLPIVILLGVSFMYVITIVLIMCTANVF